MIIREIEHLSEDYRRAVELRRIVLRFPLGMDYTEEQLQSENDSVHFLLEVDGEVLGSAMYTPYDETTIKVRQVAVHPDHRGKGLGAKLMLAVEWKAASKGFTKSVLHARQVAVAFYERIGYECFDEPFEEVGIPHRKMRKDLLFSSAG
ncbi:MAG TPA: GNAT family N-acetyltransferase [Fimbriimonas sp.]|nr:GNAT family N-acetyltransferase [Fimbriimonas sp.]